MPAGKSRIDFHSWLMAQAGRDDPIGDLAKDARHDPGFKDHCKTKAMSLLRKMQHDRGLTFPKGETTMTTEQIERMIEEHNRQMTDHAREMADHAREIAEIWALFRKTDEQQMRNAKQQEETDEKMRKLIDTWARFVEKFVAPGIPRAFQDRGIDIVGTAERQKRKLGGESMEIDVLGVDSGCVVAVEVKTTLRPEHVHAHLEKLRRFKEFFHEYRDRRVYGAVAGIDVAQAADSCAENNGLWVIRQSGDAVVIGNDPGFRPKEW